MKKIIDIDGIINLLIRPPRFTYSVADLGANKFQIGNRTYKRHDFKVNTERKEDIYGSIYFQGELCSLKICVLYLHCNCGCRLQAKSLIEPCLKAGYGLIAFDFVGCGHSTGQFISLGYHEALDLKDVISYMKVICCSQLQLILWGRSMGAVTAVRYLLMNEINNVKLAILDSPFIQLRQVIIELVNSKIGVPKLLIEMFLNYISPMLQKKANFQISDLDLTASINKITCPLIFIASKSDDLVPFAQIEKLYESHRAKKTIFYLEEAHNQPRRPQLIQNVFKEIWKYLIETQRQYHHPLLPKRSVSKNKITVTVREQSVNNRNPVIKRTKQNEEPHYYTHQTCTATQIKKLISYKSKQVGRIKTVYNQKYDKS